MDDTDMTSRSTWGQGTGQNSECDFLNMLPDDEYLELCSPVFLPTANPSQFSSRGRLNAAGHVWMNNPEAYSAVPASLPAQSDEQPRSFPNDLDAKRAAKRMRTEQLNAWGLSTDEQYSNPDMPDDDDDQLTCSSCPDVCPSNCGETGQGLICCDSDDCEAQPEEDLCVDQACEGAISPCTDENCLVEPIAACGIKEQPHYESVDNSSSVAPPDPKEEAEAAAALTSFGDLGELGSVNSFSEGNPFNGFNNGFSLGTSSQQLSSQGQGAHSMAFGPQFNTNASNGQSSIFPFAPFPSGPNDGSYGPSPQPANVELFSHIFQYHGPSDSHTDHMRPCLADNPNIFGSRCPLPDPTSNEPISHTSDNGQSPGLRCDFTAEDPARFTDHLLSAHRWHLQSLTNLNAALGYIAWNQLRQGYGNINQGFGGANRANNSLSGSPLQAFYPNVNGGPVGQTSTSATPGTDSPISTTPLPTPDSPLTAHSLEPGSESILESRDTSPVTGRPGQSLGPQNAYQCFWGDPETGEPCGQNFGNSDELDSHCKAAHTKNLAKGPGGFQCSWESCKRGKDFFLTKAKLNRHLQTHTGFKPMECHICGLRLSAKQALDQHIRTHTNEQPYKCQYGCGRTFKQHSALTMHHRTHTKEKPLKCDECGAVFTESSNLSKHKRTHMVRGMYECELCDKHFHRLDQLRRHLSSNHKDRPDEVGRAIETARSKTKDVRHINRVKKRAEAAPSTSCAAPGDRVAQDFSTYTNPWP